MNNKNLSILRPSGWSVIIASALVIAMGLGGARPADAKSKGKKIVIESSDESKAFLGIVMQELTDEVLEGLDTKVKRGVLVTEVLDDSPAEKAGIEEGDIIVEFGGRKVDSPDELRDLIAEKKDGDEVKVKLARGKKTETVEVTLGDWEDQPFVGWVTPGDHDFFVPQLRNYVGMFRGGSLGVRVSDIDSDLGSYFGVKEGEGVLVLDVNDESTAEAIGLKSGDVITEVQGENIQSARDIRESLSDVDPGDQVKVTVVRNKKKLELAGELKESNFQAWHHQRWGRNAPRVRSFYVPDDNQELRQEIDELRKEIEQLKEELKKS